MRTVSRILLLAAALGLPSVALGASNLYWLDTNYAAPTLNRSDPNGNGVTTIPLTVGSLPEGLTVDDGGLLYWAEAPWYGARIMRSTTALSAVTPVQGDGSVDRGIALDDVANQIYWTTSNLASGASTRRASVLGGPAITIVTLAPGANPRGIAVDHAGGKIYWTDFGLSTINRANLD